MTTTTPAREAPPMLGLLAAPAAAPVPPPAPPAPNWVARLAARLTRWAGRKAADGLIALLVKAPGGLLVLLYGCAYWLVNQTIRGRFRHHLRPAWLAAGVLYVTPWTPWAWLAVGFLFDLWREPRRWISRREQRVVARACGVAAAWQVLAPALASDRRWLAGSLTVTAVAALLPWWRGRAWRSAAPEPEAGPHELEVAWDELVAESSRAGDLAGSVITIDPEHEDRAHMRVMPGALSGNVVGAAELAASLLGRGRGSVTISEDPHPEATALDFLVGFPSRVRTGEVRHWQAPIVDDAFTWDAGDSLDRRALPLAIGQRGGAVNIIVIAKSGAGKGSILRQVGVVAARHPKVFLAVNDCKGEEEGGAGVPELRHGADAYGRTADQWRAIACMRIEILAARAARYGKAGKNFWHPDQVVDGYTDPLFVHITDEFRRFLDTHPAMRGAWEQMAAAQRSLGMQDTISTQRGVGDDLATTRAKNDLRGNGVVCIGPAGDDTSERIATSDFGVNLSRLPVDQGWFYIQSKVLEIAPVQVRIRHVPTADEVNYLGFHAPHGTVEEWLAPDQIHSGLDALHPEDRDIYAKWLPEFAEPIPGEVIAQSDAAPAGGDDRGVVEVAPGVSVERPSYLALVKTSAPVPSTEDRVIDLLRTHGPLTRGAIATALDLSDGHTSDVLKAMAGNGLVQSAKVPGARYPVWTLRSAA